MVGNVSSDTRPLVSGRTGTPQGSVLGPILFIVHKQTSLPDIFEIAFRSKLYADDLKSNDVTNLPVPFCYESRSLNYYSDSSYYSLVRPF